MAEYHLAYMLGVTHHTLMEEMSNEEFYGWSNYFERQPPGWRDDLRAYYIMSSMSGGKTKPEDIFPSIKQLRLSELDKTVDEKKDDDARALQQSLKASPFFSAFSHLKK